MKTRYELLRDNLLTAIIIIASLEVVRLLFYNFEL